MRIEVLTFLRFIAAVVVVVFHFAKKGPLITPSPGLLTAGPEMVSFFFVLSGFVMIVSHWNRTEQPLHHYYWARFARIAPVYFLALGLTVAVLPAYDKTVLVAHVLFLQAWLIGMPISINITGWSISVEVFFYAIFPFALALARHPRFRPNVILAAAFAMWGVTQLVVTYLENTKATQAFRTGLHDLVFYFPPVHLCSFLLGVMGGAWYLSTAQTRAQTWSQGRLVRSLVAMGSLIVAYLLIEFRARWQVVAGVLLSTSAALLAPLFLWVILSLARAEGPVARFFSRKPFVVLGEASFAFYILQFPVQRAYVKWVLPPNQPNFGFDMSVEHFLKFAAILLALSIASVYLFEKPMRKLMLRLIEPRGGAQRAQVGVGVRTQ
jgi:peptidoglycan/LPS O-acetylase OafA/YrhL